NSRTYTVSPYHLKVPALGDRMKAADPSVRVVTVAGKDRAAVMMGGHAPDQRWWWAKDRFVTHAGAVPPPITAQVNASIADALSRARPALALSPLCAPKNKAVAVGDFTVGTHRFARAGADSSAFTGSPELDAATLTMAAALTQQLQLGRGGRTDLLAIGLSATDYVGHRYGTDGVEMCLQLQSLDADLASFFTVLDRTGIDYAVVLTADHGGNDLPERDGPPSARALEALDPSALSAAIGAELGLTGPIIRGDGPAGDMYIDRGDPARNAAIQAAVKRRLANHPQVEAVLSWAELSAMPVPTGSAASWTAAQRARASFDPDRSGDLVMLLKPEITPIPNPSPGYVATHGSPWDYDRQVPILFWWKGVRAAERGESARTVDILPTLATLIGLPVSESEIDGRALSLGAR
ncbi:MAG: alkaline phosphatase family protein, partial [Pseudomonadota bacterium]|nr:alkaline phosphatase family protein [Pseudomonadota bacterium]